jgi:folate-dependent tRNA-U54 methylase TrmFO/GidA
MYELTSFQLRLSFVRQILVVILSPSIQKKVDILRYSVIGRHLRIDIIIELCYLHMMALDTMLETWGKYQVLQLVAFLDPQR